MYRPRNRWNFNVLYEEFIRSDISLSLKDYLLQSGFKATNGQFGGNVLRKTKGWTEAPLKHHKGLLKDAGAKADEESIEELKVPLKELLRAKKSILDTLIKRIHYWNSLSVETISIEELIKLIHS